MHKIKVVKQEELIKGNEELFEGVKEKIVGVVIGVMQGVKESLEAELRGIGLLVMQTVMELEIAQMAGKKHKHQQRREYTRWGSNPGSVVLDGQRVKSPVPRAVEVKTQKAYRLKSYGLFRQAGGVDAASVLGFDPGISTRRYQDGVQKFLDGYGASAAAVSRRMSRAYSLVSYEDARKELLALAGELESINPSAARSLMEGLEETLTLHRLGLPEVLRRSLQSTNLIESALAVVRHVHRNVKRWQDGKHVQRWIGAGLLEAEKHFRRVKGYAAMNILIDALTNLRQGQQKAA